MGSACCSQSDSKSSDVVGIVEADISADGPAVVGPEPKGSERKADEQPDGEPVTLTIKFGVPGEEDKDIVFAKRPLGLDFDKRAPIVLKRVQQGGHGDELKVQPGWTLLAVSGEDMREKSFDYIYDRLRSQSAALSTSS